MILQEPFLFRVYYRLARKDISKLEASIPYVRNNFTHSEKKALKYPE